MTEEYKLIVIVRSDLGLSKGKLAVQVGHASVSCALKAHAHERRLFDAWYRHGQKKIVAKAPGLRELHDLKSMAESRRLMTSLITDAGLTEVPPGTTTCLGIGPALSKDIDHLTGDLPLL